jgi:LDH2 family malate/lactate/ureidoglycolate dehydrogenase
LRLLPQYLDELETGVANASARIRVIRDRGAEMLIDAGGAVEFLAGLAAAPATSSQPDLAPGDPQRAHQRERRVRGIPLDARAADVLSALATRIGVPLRRAADDTDDTEDEIAS